LKRKAIKVDFPRRKRCQREKGGRKRWGVLILTNRRLRTSSDEGGGAKSKKTGTKRKGLTLPGARHISCGPRRSHDGEGVQR